LQQQGLTPAGLGKANWDEVKFIGRKEYSDLPSRPPFLLEQLVIPHASSLFYSECGPRLLKAGIRPQVPILVNSTISKGRFYQPGLWATTAPGKTSTPPWDSTIGWNLGVCVAQRHLHRGLVFGDDLAYQWSYYANRLRSAAQLSDVGVGSLVIPRTSGARPGGMPQKLLALIGNGAKTINFFVFGPEYSFPGNCYSEVSSSFKPLATPWAWSDARKISCIPDASADPTTANLRRQMALGIGGCVRDT